MPIAGATEVQTFDWIQIGAASNLTLVEALSHELDIAEAEAIALSRWTQLNVGYVRRSRNASIP